MASKRSFELSTGDSPGKRKPKLASYVCRSRKTLFKETTQSSVLCRKERPVPWTKQETSILVQYICLYWKDAWNDKWPTTKDNKLWDGCAQAINNSCKSQRTGTSCRSRVLKSLSKEYKTLSDAEKDLEIDYVLDFVNLTVPVPSSPAVVFDYFNDNLSPVFRESPCEDSAKNITWTPGDIVQNLITSFKCNMSQRLKEQLLNYLYKLVVVECGGMDLYNFVQKDFLDESLNAMKTLQQNGKKNLLYGISKCFEGRADDATVTRMPLNQMPFGLIDYNIRFFAADSSQKLGIEDYYVQWLSAMFAHFGHRWMCLFRGPYWQYEVEEEQNNSKTEDGAEASILENGKSIIVLSRKPVVMRKIL